MCPSHDSCAPYPLPQTLDEKKEWNVHFDAYIRDLDSKKPVIWTGDLNVAATEMGMYSNYPFGAK